MIGSVLLLPLLVIESDFSLVFGGIPLNAAALYVVWRLIARSAAGVRHIGMLRPAEGRYEVPHL